MKAKNRLGMLIAWVLTAIILIIALMIVSCILLPGYGEVYETTSISDYGKITGNFDNAAPAAFVHAFFPKEIEDSFSSVIYHYKAKKGDSYAYECYLEFVIENTVAYEAFLERCVDRDASSSFAYDESFQEQSISNVLSLQEPKKQEAMYAIGMAEIGKILFSDEQQRLIFVAIGMYDGGGANTIELGHFFTRFHIDPWDYMQDAYASVYYQDLGIQNKNMSPKPACTTSSPVTTTPKPADSSMPTHSLSPGRACWATICLPIAIVIQLIMWIQPAWRMLPLISVENVGMRSSLGRIPVQKIDVIGKRSIIAR